ncbi:nudC domain-containing protein 3 [Betta splendens]|uniref:NudC domain-containing protein 3 n=1 Tax=Betta splendens TaxID=158456 RepID=A0A6P7NYN6_BETSP|nr:nudC domain-containing protein 3 [Betta splendens]XP_055369332.1 nudC domain-containing protein 3 [Betta splendens]
MASPLEMTEMYDNALLGILQHVGNIQDFLQVFFGFLYRKTDFYRLLSGPNDKMGFPPGAAEKMVLKTSKLFETLAQRDRERLSELQKKEDSCCVPRAVEELEVTTQQSADQVDQVDPVLVQSSSVDAGELSVPVAPEPSCSTSSVPVLCEDQAAAASAKPADAGQDTFQCNPDSYNGAVRDTYSWSQDYTDVEVRVFVPSTVVKGRQVSVALQTSSVRVSVREAAKEKTLLEGEFTHKINTENSLWSLEPGKCVVLSLSKSSEVWWDAILKGEKAIDINQINRERNMASVDDEEHAVLDRLTFDYHQKLQGKPQSHELKVHEMLKKGWDAEGSPFKGQQFDPSMFDIPPSAVQF